ncbi:MAG: hypothetical protein ACYTGZ_02575 [Planctomycetota bacterium]|jgi:hypothetical protein
MVLLADIPLELIFFLVAAVITLITRAFEKSKKVRQESIRKQKKRTEATRMVLPGTETPPPMPPPLPSVVMAPPVTAPVVPPPPRRQRPVPPRTGRARPRIPVRPAAAPVRKRQSKSALAVLDQLRGGRDALRSAIALREILGPPVSMRPRGFPRR